MNFVVWFLWIAFVPDLFLNAFESSYISHVQQDELTITFINIPRHANQVEIILWCLESSISPSVFMKYDGLPTLMSYDHIVPNVKSAIRIVDLQPTGSTLFIGYHGGAMLHSFYYFAGEAEYTLVGVDTSVSQCGNDLLHGENCNLLRTTLPVKSTLCMKNRNITTTESKDVGIATLSQSLGDVKEFMLPIPPNIESFSVSVRIPSIPSSICPLLTTQQEASYKLLLVVDLFLDQAQEEENSGRSSAEFSVSDMCNTPSVLPTDVNAPGFDVKLSAKYPQGGNWIVRVRVLTNSTATASPPTRTRTTTSHAALSSTATIQNSGISRKRFVVSEVPDYSTDKADAETVATRSLQPHKFNVKAEPSLLSLGSRPQLSSRDKTEQRVLLTSKLDNNDTLISVVIESEVQLCMDGFTGYDEWLTTSNSSTASTQPTSCNTPVHFMESFRTDSASLGHLAFFSQFASSSLVNSSQVDGEQAELRRRDGTVVSPYVLFSTPPMSRYNPSALIGGAMIVQLKVVIPQNNSQQHNSSRYGSLSERYSKMVILAAVRVGGIPSDPSVMQQTSGGSTADIFQSSAVQSFDAYLLSSRDAVISYVGPSRYSGDDDGDDDDSRRRNRLLFSSEEAFSERLRSSRQLQQSDGDQIAERPLYGLFLPGSEYTLTWTLHKPVLPNLLSGDNQIFVRVSAAMSTDPSDLFGSLLVSAKVLFTPCTTSSCGVHGRCVVTQGDIQYAECECMFPYGGEKCEEMIMPHWEYILQVCTMVLSNLAMLPGIMLSFHKGVPVLGTSLTFAMLSSMLYHLCDTNTYCIADLSFQSLQVLDILFCTLCMAAVTLFYAPISKTTHSSLVLLSVGMLVSPIVSFPTNALNIILAMVCSLAVTIGFWVLYALKLDKHTRIRIPANCCFGSKSGSDERRNRSQYAQLPRSEVYSAGAEGEETDNEHEFLNHIGVQLTLGGDSSAHSNGVREVSVGRSGSSKSSESSSSGEDNNSRLMVSRSDVEAPNSSAAIDSRSRRVGAIDEDDEASDNAKCSTLHRTVLSVYNCISDLPYHMYDLRFTLVGLVLAAAGLACFASQTRLNYWYVHSMWHLFVMSSSYCLVRGRYHFMTFMEFAPHFSQ